MLHLRRTRLGTASDPHDSTWAPETHAIQIWLLLSRLLLSPSWGRQALKTHGKNWPDKAGNQHYFTHPPSVWARDFTNGPTDLDEEAEPRSCEMRLPAPSKIPIATPTPGPAPTSTPPPGPTRGVMYVVRVAVVVVAAAAGDVVRPRATCTGLC